MRCPDGSVLDAWVDDELGAHDARQVAAHVDCCRSCAQLVRSQRHVKAVTTGLSARPDPAPCEDLLHSLLRMPAAEQSRQRAVRRAAGSGSPSRTTSAALGVGLGAGLVAVAWLVPVGVSSPAPSGGPAPVVPATAPAPASPRGTPATSPADVSLVRWSRGRD